MILLLNPYYQHPDQYSVVSERPKRLLKVLYVQDESCGSASMCALRYHHRFESLEVLSLKSSGIRSIHILTILTSCPSLKSITAPVIHAADVARAKNCPWIYLGLQIWDVNITFTLEYNVPPPSFGPPTSTTSEATDRPTIAEMQEGCIEQIGRLYQLKSLKTMKGLYRFTETFSLVLSKGLERLAGLGQLEEVTLGGLTPQDEDLDWMGAHWRSLKHVNYVWMPTTVQVL